MVRNDDLQQFFASLSFPERTCSKAVELCAAQDIYATETLLSLSLDDIEAIGFTVGVKNEVVKHLKPLLSIDEIQESLKVIKNASAGLHKQRTVLKEKITLCKTELQALQTKIDKYQTDLDNTGALDILVKKVLALQSNPALLVASSSEIQRAIELCQLMKFSTNIVMTMEVSSGVYSGCTAAQNTLESLQDGNFDTGVVAESPGVITFSFDQVVSIEKVKTAGFCGDTNTFCSTNGQNAAIEYLQSGTWVKVGSIPGSHGQRVIQEVSFASVETKALRFNHTCYLGLSHFSYE